MNLGIAVLRATIGAVMIGHGTQKLFGWFGGHGLDGTAQAFESIGLRPGKRNALCAGVSEAGGGALLVLGLLTPLGASAVIGAMTTAMRVVHWGRGPWVTEGGWEYNAAIIAACYTIVDDGPGPLSLDAASGREEWGTLWALCALATGAAGSELVIRAGRRRREQEEQTQVQQGDGTTESAQAGAQQAAA